jgi:uncharacterized cupin superfamily protein
MEGADDERFDLSVAKAAASDAARQWGLELGEPFAFSSAWTAIRGVISDPATPTRSAHFPDARQRSLQHDPSHGFMTVKIFNLNRDEWDRVEEREGWRSKDAWVGAHIGAELIGGSMYELEPGDRLWPYHTHHANEEWLLVIRGTPTLRSPEGEQDLREGDVVCFVRGKDGAHQISNRTDSPIRVLMLSTRIAPDVIEYLDSGKIGARSIAGERILLSRPGPTLDYWEGED